MQQLQIPGDVLDDLVVFSERSQRNVERLLLALGGLLVVLAALVGVCEVRESVKTSKRE